MSFLNKNNEFIDNGKTNYDFISQVFVVCPCCSKRAIVKKYTQENARVICTFCGYVKEWIAANKESQKTQFKPWDKNISGSILTGAPVDPYFKENLYY